MVYHAILRRNDGDGSKDRFVMTAPDADTMDELYRKVKDCKENVAKIERRSPDYYTWEGPDGSVSDHAKELKIILSALPDIGVHSPPPVLYNEPRTDRKSGNSFYIRSKSNNSVYWYCTGADENIFASTVGRTRFCIAIADGNDADRKTVMVNSDPITISTAHTTDTLYVKASKKKLILSEDEGTQYHLRDLTNHFIAEGEPGVAGGKEAKNAAVIMIIDHGLGEAWELVD